MVHSSLFCLILSLILKLCPGSSYVGSCPPQMSLSCMTTADQNIEFKSTCVQDDIFNKLESDKLK